MKKLSVMLFLFLPHLSHAQDTTSRVNFRDHGDTLEWGSDRDGECDAGAQEFSHAADLREGCAGED